MTDVLDQLLRNADRAIAVDHGVSDTRGFPLGIRANFAFVELSQQRWYFRYAPRIVTVSGWLREQLPAGLHDRTVPIHNGADHYPLQHLDPKQAPFDVHDSALSEAAVMGFEFGYSLDSPESLVVWEAQFGDFANGAQVIIDQFLTSCESKWNRSSGLVLLLPHAYEGQGPEHSSARLERFLQMCAEDNIQVAYPTTPAQYFHLLRRQVKRNFRKPLVAMTPKSLLRLPAAVSPVSEFGGGTSFREVLDDAKAPADLVARVLICSGKVYYDLAKQREESGTQAVAILRLEQLYPWPEAQLAAALGRYRRAREFVWVQEESQNMGGWAFVEPRFRAMGLPIQYVGRDASASPATDRAIPPPPQ